MALLAMLGSSQSLARGNCTPSAASVLPSLALTVSPSHPVGTAIGAAGGYAFGGIAMRCTYREWPFQYYAESRINTVSLNHTGRNFSYGGVTMPVYYTAISGVGIAMMAKDPNQSFRAVSVNPVALHGATRNKPGTWGLDGRMFLVAIGPVNGGSVPRAEWARFIITDADIGSPGHHSVIFNSITVSPPAKPTCRVNTTALALPLGDVAIERFGAVGSTAGSVTRDISMTCSGGGTGTTREVFITITDQTLPSNRSDRLSLTTGSTAKGIGIQMLRSGTLIRYGADSTTVGNVNQWRVGTYGNTTFNIPLSARYVRTAQDISPGTANGRATFTMAYR
ncbi:fimbrial protein [Pseudomonas pergaminensis]